MRQHRTQTPARQIRETAFGHRWKTRVRKLNEHRVMAGVGKRIPAEQTLKNDVIEEMLRRQMQLGQIVHAGKSLTSALKGFQEIGLRVVEQRRTHMRRCDHRPKTAGHKLLQQGNAIGHRFRAVVNTGHPVTMQIDIAVHDVWGSPAAEHILRAFPHPSPAWP